MRIAFTVNGTDVDLGVDPMRRLLDILRSDLGVLDVKEGCGEGECGACTVLLNGKPVPSCLVSAAHVDGGTVITAGGIAETGPGTLLVDCFDEIGAVQCGFCFPGILVASYHYLVSDGEPSLDRIRRSLSGNLCRCTGYRKIFHSVLLACSRKEQTWVGSAVADVPGKEAMPVERSVSNGRNSQKHTNFYRPNDIAELLHLCDTLEGKKYFLAGGTDLNVQRRKGTVIPDSVFFIRHLPELRGIVESENEIRIGGATCFEDMINSVLLRKHAPFFCRSLELFASPGIRNLATPGGNIANGSPTADVIPLLLVLTARMELVSRKRKRIVPVEEFYTGYKRNILSSTELISAIILTKNAESGFYTYYRKVGSRQTLNIAKISLAAMTRVSDERIDEVRLAVGSVNEFPRRLRRTEALLTGCTTGAVAGMHKRIKRAVREEITPITDFRSDAAYRGQVCLNLIDDFLMNASTESTEKNVVKMLPKRESRVPT